ncbi:unnamed protein product [Musa acuminata var. zebrina]
MASSDPAAVVLFLAVLSLLSANASARPGIPFNTVFVSYTITTTASSDDALPGLHQTSVFVYVYRIIAPIRNFHPDPRPTRIARPALLPRSETRIASPKRIPCTDPIVLPACVYILLRPSRALWRVASSESELMSSVGNGDGCCAGGSDGGQRHVLAVDDSSVDRAVIAGILRSSKLRVTAVDSGKRALELLGLVRRNLPLLLHHHRKPCVLLTAGEEGREHDHHRLLDAGDDRIRTPQESEGVLRAEGDSGGHHVLRERPQQDHQVSGGGSRRVPAEAHQAVRCVPGL